MVQFGQVRRGCHNGKAVQRCWSYVTLLAAYFLLNAYLSCLGNRSFALLTTPIRSGHLPCISTEKSQAPAIRNCFIAAHFAFHHTQEKPLRQEGEGLFSSGIPDGR